MSAGHKLFGAYDIRGIYGDSLDESFAFLLGKAFGRYLSPYARSRILVGHDSRSHSPSLAQALVDGLTSEGHDVVTLGVASTPLVTWYGAHHGFDASVSVTASHLAGQFNGFKLYRGQAEPIGAKNGLREIESILLSLKEQEGHDEGNSARSGNEDTNENGSGDLLVAEKGRGAVTAITAYATYIDFLLAMLNPERRLRIAIDVGHGAAAPEIGQLRAASTKADLFVIADTVDGTFPSRSPNPLDEGALDALKSVVTESRCDFGVAFDGDADRAIFLDETGRMIETDLIIGIVGGNLVKRAGGGSVIYDLRSSRAVPEYVEAQGGSAVRTGVGTMFIKSNMQEHRAIFGGELSGHYYYGDMFDTDNALRTMIEVINLVASSQVPLSQLVEPLSKYSTSGEINLRVNKIEEVLRHLDEAITDGAKERIDGLSVNFQEWWFAVRGSQTEPVLRLTVGAVNREILDSKTKHLIGVINQLETSGSRN